MVVEATTARGRCARFSRVGRGRWVDGAGRRPRGACRPGHGPRGVSGRRRSRWWGRCGARRPAGPRAAGRGPRCRRRRSARPVGRRASRCGSRRRRRARLRNTRMASSLPAWKGRSTRRSTYSSASTAATVPVARPRSPARSNTSSTFPPAVRMCRAGTAITTSPSGGSSGTRCRGWVDGPQPTGLGVHPVEQAAVHGLQVRQVEPAAHRDGVVAGVTAAGTLAHRLPPRLSEVIDAGAGWPCSRTVVNLGSSRPRSPAGWRVGPWRHSAQRIGCLCCRLARPCCVAATGLSGSLPGRNPGHVGADARRSGPGGQRPRMPDLLPATRAVEDLRPFPGGGGCRTLSDGRAGWRLLSGSAAVVRAWGWVWTATAGSRPDCVRDSTAARGHPGRGSTLVAVALGLAGRAGSRLAAITGDHPAGFSDTGVKSVGPQRFPVTDVISTAVTRAGTPRRAVPRPRSRRAAVVGIGAGGGADDDVFGKPSSAVRAHLDAHGRGPAGW